ncbi:DNA topoisomerase [Glomus cerebriforme]|uniref:DNA topoisomerase (ATP-hydrolyzing) n=1 Tax=Glomus cerebriforme TaxID=658196 RepID=A0A397T7I7_9GLOM|nr:DNA topoisomerase [Glomus cerebriforme]
MMHIHDFTSYFYITRDLAASRRRARVNFNKKKAEDRKEWLKNYEPGTFMNHDVNEITITDFMIKELIELKIYKNFKNKIKVSLLAGAVLEQAAYHHGDAGLQQTIIAMAHDFVDSNNINVLHGEGQFGTRAQGGKDAASARYTCVTIPALTRNIFHRIAYLIVMMTVSWSLFIPNYNPRDIVNNLKRLINDEEPIPMHPWYRGFQGDIEQINMEI